MYIHFCVVLNLPWTEIKFVISPCVSDMHRQTWFSKVLVHVLRLRKFSHFFGLKHGSNSTLSILTTVIVEFLAASPQNAKEVYISLVSLYFAAAMLNPQVCTLRIPTVIMEAIVWNFWICRPLFQESAKWTNCFDLVSHHTLIWFLCLVRLKQTRIWLNGPAFQYNWILTDDHFISSSIPVTWRVSLLTEHVIMLIYCILKTLLSHIPDVSPSDTQQSFLMFFFMAVSACGIENCRKPDGSVNKNARRRGIRVNKSIGWKTRHAGFDEDISILKLSCSLSFRAKCVV